VTFFSLKIRNPQYSNLLSMHKYSVNKRGVFPGTNIENGTNQRQINWIFKKILQKTTHQETSSSTKLIERLKRKTGAKLRQEEEDKVHF
jgi:hypothetical protein